MFVRSFPRLQSPRDQINPVNGGGGGKGGGCGGQRQWEGVYRNVLHYNVPLTTRTYTSHRMVNQV